MTSIEVVKTSITSKQFFSELTPPGQSHYRKYISKVRL